MSGAKFTPGPWSRSQWRETDGEGELMARGWQILAGGHLLPLCEQTGGAEEAEANAALIAAAPDLYAALTKINEWACFASEEDVSARLMALQQIGLHARAAIAKAEGRS